VTHLPASSPDRRPAGRAGRGIVSRTRPILVPLIGQRAFSYCVRVQYFVRSLLVPLLVGPIAIILAGFTQAPLQLALFGIWGASVLYCLVGLGLVFVWTKMPARLASRKLSAELGYPIHIRGAGAELDVDVWKRRVDRAMQQHRTANERAARRGVQSPAAGSKSK